VVPLVGDCEMLVNSGCGGGGISWKNHQTNPSLICWSEKFPLPDTARRDREAG